MIQPPPTTEYYGKPPPPPKRVICEDVGFNWPLAMIPFVFVIIGFIVGVYFA